MKKNTLKKAAIIGAATPLASGLIVPPVVAHAQDADAGVLVANHDIAYQPTKANGDLLGDPVRIDVLPEAKIGDVVPFAYEQFKEIEDNGQIYVALHSLQDMNHGQDVLVTDQAQVLPALYVRKVVHIQFEDQDGKKLELKEIPLFDNLDDKAAIEKAVEPILPEGHKFADADVTLRREKDQDSFGTLTVKVAKEDAQVDPNKPDDKDENDQGQTPPAVEKKAPVLTLTPAEIVATVGEDVDIWQGVTATDEDSQVAPDVKIKDMGGYELGSPKAGRFEITFEATDGDGLSTTAVRVIEVKEPEKPNTPPELINTLPAVEIKVGEALDLLEGLSATDAEDGDLTGLIKIVSDGGLDTTKAGQYVVRYIVEDSKGEVATAERIVTVKEETPVPNTAPKLEIAYPSFSTVIGTPLNVQGNIKTAYDDEDGEGLAKVVIDAPGASVTPDGYVYTTPGTYKVTYSLTDKEGLTTTVEMTVTVKNKPVITATQNLTLFAGSSYANLIAAANVVATDGYGTPLVAEIVGGFDLNVPGVYNVEFVAVNADGVDARVPVTITVIEAPREGVVVLANDVYTTTAGNPVDLIGAVQVSRDGRILSASEVASIARIEGVVDYSTPGVYHQRIVVTVDGKTYTKDVGIEVLSASQAQARSLSVAGSANIPTQAVNQGKVKTDTAAVEVASGVGIAWYAAIPFVGTIAHAFAKRKKK